MSAAYRCLFRSLMLLATVALLAGASPAGALNCANTPLCGFHSCGTPASGQPAALWGELQPTTTGTLPANRDSAFFTLTGLFGNANPYWMDLAVRNGYVFAATNAGFEVWDARNNPGDPLQLANEDFYAVIPFWSNNFETKYYFQALAAPPDQDDIVAVVGRDGVGMVLWDTSVKNSPEIIYQDHGLTSAHKFGYGVYATTIGGRHYAFMAAENVDGGVYAYDLTAASAISGQCIEARPTSVNGNCSNVYQGKVGSRTKASYIDGAGDYLVFSSGALQRGLEIWNVSTPSAPTSVLSTLTSEIVYGVAMWIDGGTHYLALRTVTQGRIYRLDCLSSGSCSSLGSPIATFGVNATARNFITFSRSAGVPFLYFGVEKICAGPGQQDEWLYDVSDPANPVDITPAPQLVSGQLTGYWGWAYPLNPTGFNFVYPRNGEFHGEYFYRAAHSIFDIHRRTTPTPPSVGNVVANPNPATVCQQITFTAQNVMGQEPLTFSWAVLDDAQQVVETGGDVNPFVWATPSNLPAGQYTAEVTVENNFGSDSAVSGPVTINAVPTLQFTGAGQAPTADPFAGPTVQFHIQDQGASQWQWDFGDGTVQTFTDPTAGRNPSHTYTQTGIFQVTVTISNCVDPTGITSNPLIVEIVNTGPLVINTFAAQGCQFGFCSFSTGDLVTFEQSVKGNPDSYEYDWNGDSNIDQVSPTPVSGHSFKQPGSFRPVLQVRRSSETVSFVHARDVIIDGSPVPAPTAPTGLMATPNGDTAMDLGWTDNSNSEDSYRVEQRNVTEGTAFVEVAFLPVNTTATTLSDLVPGTAYEFRVRAVNTSGASAYSNVANATTLGAPDAPSALAATAASATLVQLAWTDNSSDEDGFRIYRSEFGGIYVAVADTAANATSFDDTGRDGGTTYSYRVTAFSSGGESTTSNTDEATTPLADDLIFADDAEGGDLTAWSTVVSDGGDLSADAAAALFGSFGFQACVDDTNSIYLSDETPDNLGRYRVRFHFDPNSISMPENKRHKLLTLFQDTPTTGRLATVVFRLRGSQYALLFKIHQDDNSWIKTPFLDITDAPHALELEWTQATGPGANDGRLRAWIDGTLVGDLTGVDNDERSVDSVRFGKVGGVDVGTAGCSYFDQFESRTDSYMGPFSGP